MSWLQYDEDKANGYAPIPLDTELPVRISEAEHKVTAKGGQMVTLVLAVIEGPHKGRKIWHRLHIQCSSEAMSHRARRALAGIAKIVHVDISGGPGDLGKLKGRDLLCTVTEHEKDEYNGKTSIKERVDNFRTDPDAKPYAADVDDDDIPF